MNNEMMSGSAEMMPGMMLGMGLMGFLVLVVLVLSTAALVKYLFFENRVKKKEGSTDDKHGF